MATRNRVVAVVGAGVLALASTLVPSHKAADLIKESEGYRNTAYADSVGVQTVCYGSTRGVYHGMKVTDAECERRLKEDMDTAGKIVGKYVQVRLTQDQYDGLTSFVYNFGETKFRKSTLLRKVNAGDCWGAGAEFPKWKYAGKEVLRGLVIRRAKERSLWESGCASAK